MVPPLGVAAVTVLAAGAISELEGYGESLCSYELGPDGATFDEPVELRFAVPSEELARGVLVVARSSDGAVEPLNTTVDVSADPVALVATINHFTVVELVSGIYADITLLSPSLVDLGNAVPVDLRIELTPEQAADGGYDSGSYDVEEGFLGEWLALGSVSGSGPGDFVCSSPGFGSIAYSGLASVDFAPESGTGSFREVDGWTVRSRIDVVSGDIKCLGAGGEIGFLDESCQSADGSVSTECVFLDTVTLVGGDSAALLVSTDRSLAGAADEEMTISLVLNPPEGDIVLIECGPQQGCTSFFGPGFESFEVDLAIEISVIDGRTRPPKPTELTGMTIYLDAGPIQGIPNCRC